MISRKIGGLSIREILVLALFLPVHLLASVLYVVGVGLTYCLTTLRLIPKRYMNEFGGSGSGPYNLFALALSLLFIALTASLMIYSKATVVPLALVGLVAAACAWSFRAALKAAEARAKLIIIEVLSNCDGATREELRSSVLAYSWYFRIFKNVYSEALGALYDSGKLQVAKGLYSLKRPDEQHT